MTLGCDKLTRLTGWWGTGMRTEEGRRHGEEDWVRRGTLIVLPWASLFVNKIRMTLDR